MAKNKKLTLSQTKQIIFVFKEVTKLTYKIRPKMLIGVFVINVLWGLSSLPGFYLEKLIVDTLVKGVQGTNLRSALYFISFLFTLYILLQIARRTLSRFNRVFQSSLSRLLVSEIDILLGEKLSQLDMKEIENPEYRDRFEKIERESGRRAWGLMIPLTDIPNYFFGMISSLIVIFAAFPFIALGIVLISIPKFFSHSKFIKDGYSLNTKLAMKNRLWGWLNSFLVRNSNYMELKLLNLSSPLTKKLRKTVKFVMDSHINLRKDREKWETLTDFPAIFYELAFSIFLAVKVFIQEITVGSFELYVRAFRSVQENFSGLILSFIEIYENYLYVKDLVWFLELQSNMTEKSAQRIVLEKAPVIKFKDVRFRYKKGDKWTLKGVKCEIKPGEKIALVGENGAGKSTLIKLLARFYDPDQGSIVVGKQNLQKIAAKSWWKNLAILFQRFELYPFSVQESIGYGDIDSIKDLKSIKKAARKAGIHEFVKNLPLKYKNPLTAQFAKGVDPSIGQYQRFGIARMLFRKNAKIIILDEPTSNVDPEAEERIFKELKKVTKNKILIFVTQRFSTVRIADRIFVMHNGKITEKGTHKELMAKKGRYARLFNLQAQAYIAEQSENNEN